MNTDVILTGVVRGPYSPDVNVFLRFQYVNTWEYSTGVQRGTAGTILNLAAARGDCLPLLAKVIRERRIGPLTRLIRSEARHLAVRLTLKLRGRTQAPDWSRGCTLSPRTRGDTSDSHGPLQRLLGVTVNEAVPDTALAFISNLS